MLIAALGKRALRALALNLPVAGFVQSVEAMGKLEESGSHHLAAGPTPGADADDLELIRGTLDGRKDDYGVLVERHQRALHRFVLQQIGDPHAADEIVQMTFVQAYTHLARFRGESTFKTWLHRVALNLCRDRARSERRRAGVAIEDALDRTPSDDPRLEDVVLGGALERRLGELPEKQRSVLNLRIWSDLSFKEIARLMGSSENSAKVNYHHAIRRLRQWLVEDIA